MTQPCVTDPSPDALFRYLVVCQVLAREARGEGRPDAVYAVAALVHPGPDGRPRRVSRRSVYRWLACYERGGMAGLEARPRKAAAASRVLEADLLRFFAAQKADDPKASVPELIRRAKLCGLVEGAVSRNTSWNVLRRMGVDTRRTRQPRHRDVRRFAWPNRMQLVLSDGKHFRAGALRRRRVAIFFLDDASRYGLDVVVGPSETCALFLRGLHLVIRGHGLMDALYLDRGGAFTAFDTAAVVSRLGRKLVFGEAGYAEARGAIERFNRTAKDQVLRHLDGNPDVDTDPASLELRVRHWLCGQYNHEPHEGLGGRTPWERWSADERPLAFPQSEDALRAAFVLPLERHASHDNIVPVDGLHYEIPLGHADQDVLLHRHLLEGRLSVRHEGRDVTIHPVDPASNATSGRARRLGDPEGPEARPTSPSAAELAWRRDMAPITGPDGGFDDPPDTEED